MLCVACVAVAQGETGLAATGDIVNAKSTNTVNDRMVRSKAIAVAVDLPNTGGDTASAATATYACIDDPSCAGKK